MGLTGKDGLNLLFMGVSTGLIAHGALSRDPDAPGGSMRLHPLLMGLGFALNISVGFWMYNYEDLPGTWIDQRESRRKIHALCQSTGAMLVIAGWIVNYQAHESAGMGLFSVSSSPVGFSQGPVWLRLIHVIVGYVCLAAMCCQVIVGILKYRALIDDNEGNDGAWAIHEPIGNSVFGMAMLNLLIGVWLWKEYTLPSRLIITLTLATSLAFGPRWDGTRGFLSTQEVSHRHVHRSKDDNTFGKPATVRA
eukprot:TRINITY_DN51550_c0_g1_i1.p1 TRINITY_DN51550_c0_g1~~TRINITY_DN51550_c0_g1_i1.p1  ORF type:complete len:268 (-),score=29.66 TRINITY_DN51550_c0_g1_i1:13-762(-)